ncbi:MAG TPA: ComEC/Rec2 family competence protein, partial [Candidatus Limnocylindria bacterium]|nr:ComEC/Rec2 family competence protein [Candidatus Limnocylindria bacterium]
SCASAAIGYTVRIRQFELLGSDETPIAALAQLRRAAADTLARVLPQPQAGLGAALTVGLRELVARDVADDFRVAGLSHVVAISGFHVALLGGMVGALLRGIGRRPRSLVVLAAIVGYAILAGGTPSVVRAALMAAVVLIARESGRRGQATAALGLAVTLMLLVEPATIESIGFQLSVAATAGILWAAGPLAGWLRRRLPRGVPDWTVETLAVSLAAQAATLPLVLFHFGRLSTVAPLSNLLVAPLVAPAMLATAVALAAGAAAALGLPAVALAPVSITGALGLGGMIAIADIAGGLPLASVELAPPLDAAAALVAAAGLAIVAIRSRTRTAAGRAPPDPSGIPDAPRGRPGPRTIAVAGTAGLALVLALVVAGRPDGRLQLTVLDVGQGDAILLQGPRGARVLVDTGPDPDRLVTLLDERLPAWDRRLDLVVISHPHEDHVAGLALLLDRYHVAAVAEPGMVGLGPGDAAYRRRMTELGRQPTILAAGDRLDVDGVRIDVHWPRRGGVPLRPADSGRTVNNVSLVLELEFGERRMLLTGDVEQEIDGQLLAAGLARDGPPFDVLKVAHHGSASATTDALLERLAPRVAIISAGTRNPYGHPSPATVARLRAAGARLFRTDLDGSVTISTDGTDLRIQAAGGRPVAEQPEPPVRQVGPLGPGFCPIPGPA